MRHLPRTVLLLLIATVASAQDAVLPTPPTVKAEGVPPIPAGLAEVISRYGQFRYASLLAWHPIDRRILISTAFGNAPQIHEVSGPGAARVQLTFFLDGVTASERNPAVTGGAWYEPVGRYFVFRKDTGGGSEAMQLFRLDPLTDATTLISDGRSRYGEPAWSHRRGLIAYDSTRRDGKNRDIYVMNPEQPDSERLIAEVQGSWAVLDWSPDDSEILAFETVSSGFGYLWRIDVTSGRRVAVTGRDGPPVRVPDARYSADGRHVLALTDNGEEQVRLWQRPVGVGAWKALTSEGQTVEAFAQSPDGRRLAVVYDREVSSTLEVLTGSGPARSVELPPGVVSRLAWRPTGEELAFVLASARTFGDVYSWHPTRGTVERWTTSEVGGANPASLPNAEIIHWTSFDGRRISGVLYRPPARFTGPRPVIINIHGGPQERERPRFLGRSNYFRNELGIAIIYPNVRGSTGFGRTFEQLDDGRRRADVVKDIGTLLDWIAGEPGFDKDRVMVTGGSYGGYLTLAAAIEYGDRIRCAFEGFGMSDLVSFLESTDESRRADRKIEYGDPADPEVRAFLKSISPLTHAARIKIPMFIAQGAKDTRVPLAQAEQMVEAIRRNGTPLWYVVYTDAGHGLTRSTNDYNTYAWVLFVQRYLLN